MISDLPGYTGPGLVGGVDGVREGSWVMAVTGTVPGSPVKEFSVWNSFSDVWSHARDQGLLAVGVDIPIGLPCGEARRADIQARSMLKPGRSSSVFPSPPMCTLGVSNYQQAQDRARRCMGTGMTKQSFALTPKIAEVRDTLCPDDLDPRARPRVAEVHPEVSFREMFGSPMRFHKSRQGGVSERLVLLEGSFQNIVEAALRTEIFSCPQPEEQGARLVSPALDDVLDAVAAAWTARRLITGEAVRLGDCRKDGAGFPQSIWV